MWRDGCSIRNVSQDQSPPGEQRSRRTARSTTVTGNPEVPAPALRCPACDRQLTYLHTVLGGVKPLERWDYFECARCGFFEYRFRTRTLRLTADVPGIRRKR
jgi:hypothetical protein